MRDETLERETTFDYDGMGREVKVDEAAFRTEETLRRGKDTKLVYDANGNVIERLTDGRFQTDGSYTGGKRATFAYDSVDQENELVVTAPNEATRRTLTDYWPSGERKSRTTKRSTAAEDTVDRMFYFSDGRLSRKDRKREGASTYAKNQPYSYGINGNRTTDERGSYVFNAREQVTRWTRPNNAVTDYGLNGSGSILTQATTGQPTITYEYEPDGQRLKAAVSGGARTVYAYDKFGSMTGYALEGQTPPLMWGHDEFGRMVTSNRGGIQTTYSYDALDRRDTKIEGGRTFDLSYVGASEALSQEQEFGGQTEFRSYDYTGNALERLGTARKTSTTPTAPYRAYSTDANGSVEGLEDDQGNLIGPAYSYDPYGTQLNSETALAADARENPFRFEGHYYDSAAKSYDMRARAYLPEIGRFLGEDRYEDPQGDQGLELDSLTQDRYAFAGGNPVDNIEFDGHKAPTGGRDSTSQSLMVFGGRTVRNRNANQQATFFSAERTVVHRRSGDAPLSDAVGGYHMPRPVAPPRVIPRCPRAYCDPNDDDFENAVVGATCGAFIICSSGDDSVRTATSLFGIGKLKTAFQGVKGAIGLTKSADEAVGGAKRARAQVDDAKLGYLFGEVTSSAHNVARSAENLAQLSRLGIRNDDAGRALLREHLEGVADDASSVARTFSNRYGTFEVRESLLGGPSGKFAKLESTWQLSSGGSRRLTTVIPFGR